MSLPRRARAHCKRARHGLPPIDGTLQGTTLVLVKIASSSVKIDVVSAELQFGTHHGTVLPGSALYGQQIVHAKTVASSCFGDEREIARDRLGLSVFIGRRTVAVPEEIKRDTLFPSFRKQMQSSEWKDFINKKGHSREAHEFENVLNKLDADCVKDYAMLRAQAELYVEDPSNVPTWERAKIDPDDVKLTFDNHPVWAHLHKRHPETFPGLVGEMRTV